MIKNVGTTVNSSWIWNELTGSQRANVQRMGLKQFAQSKHVDLFLNGSYSFKKEFLTEFSCNCIFPSKVVSNVFSQTKMYKEAQ